MVSACVRIELVAFTHCNKECILLSGHSMIHAYRKEAFAARFFLEQGSFCCLCTRHMEALAAYGRIKERDIIASIEEIK